MVSCPALRSRKRSRVKTTSVLLDHLARPARPAGQGRAPGPDCVLPGAGRDLDRPRPALAGRRGWVPAPLCVGAGGTGQAGLAVGIVRGMPGHRAGHPAEAGQVSQGCPDDRQAADRVGRAWSRPATPRARKTGAGPLRPGPGRLEQARYAQGQEDQHAELDGFAWAGAAALRAGRIAESSPDGVLPVWAGRGRCGLRPALGSTARGWPDPLMSVPSTASRSGCPSTAR